VHACIQKYVHTYLLAKTEAEKQNDVSVGMKMICIPWRGTVVIGSARKGEDYEFESQPVRP
jgi:hypothetical protein